MSGSEGKTALTAEDHNLSRTAARSGDGDGGRRHRTLSLAIDSFLQLSGPHGESPQTVQDTFNRALALLATEEHSELALRLLDTIAREGAHEGTGALRGVLDEFLESLERVAVALLDSAEAECPICTNRFADSEYPLVVRMPCGVQHGRRLRGHVFDMECVAPWLKMNPTCPMCRFDVGAAAATRKRQLEAELRQLREAEEEEEEDDWEMYG